MYNKIKHIYCNIEIRLYLYWTWYTIIAFGVDVRCGWTYRGDRPSYDECRGWWRWTRDWRSSESWRRRPCSAARYSADRRWTLQWNISTVPTAPARHSPPGAYRNNMLKRATGVGRCRQDPATTADVAVCCQQSTTTVARLSHPASSVIAAWWTIERDGVARIRRRYFENVTRSVAEIQRQTARSFPIPGFPAATSAKRCVKFFNQSINHNFLEWSQ